MCEPITLSTVATIASVGGTILGAYGQHQTGKAQERMANVRAQMQHEQAVDAISRGQQAEADHRRKVQAFKGKQRATLASNLVELDSGSASDIQADTAMLSELDALTIRNNAEREAYGYESAAAASRFEGKQSARAGTMSAAGTLLGGLGGQFANSKWYDRKSVGKKYNLNDNGYAGPPVSLMR